MLEYYEAVHNGSITVNTGLGMTSSYSWEIYTKSAKPVDATSIKVSASFYQQDFSVMTGGGAFITKGVKYSCYELLRKALLTCDTHIIDNNIESLDEFKEGHSQPSLEHCIVLDELWNNRLKTAKIHETIFEQKNLWEVLIQIGYYLHAIPYLEFAEDGSDRFVLKFHQLGNTEKRDDSNNKITVFSSRNLSEYFTQYDSYMTNLFSPQNVVEEWIVPKTSDSTFLVSNNTAELQTKYPITEIVEFQISLKLLNEEKGEYYWDNRPALEHVFEKSIYDILSNDNPYRVYPCKGSALYYSLGDNKIQGLNFVPPSKNDDLPMSLKRIIQILWQGTKIGDIAKIKFNELKFHIKYRTQDSMRITQFRPDLQNFMKNSMYEKYPHHEQYYGQQDKIVDSERFSANLWGKLIRVGNAVYQRQEQVVNVDKAKESGDLVMINSEPYYVTMVENECYADVILQKVTYTKNFNQLSQIVTIPSEPRFYEVSERSKVRREVRMMEFLELSSSVPTVSQTPRYLNNDMWRDFIKRLIFNQSKVILPNHAWMRFKADKRRQHLDSRGIEIPYNKLFPSSLLDRTDPNALTPLDSNDHSDCIVPLLHFPLHDGIVFEWDMEDNFKAGDFVDNYIYVENKPVDEAYLSMQPLRYCDVKGRADLFSFKLFNKDGWSFEESQKLPQAVINVKDADSIALVKGGDNIGIALEKDCREELSFNLQINLLHRPTEEDKQDFYTFPNLFGDKDSALKVCLLSEAQSMFSENVNIINADILADNVDYELNDETNAIRIEIKVPPIVDKQKVRSIMFYEKIGESKTAYIIKNVDGLTNDIVSWWISPAFST